MDLTLEIMDYLTDHVPVPETGPCSEYRPILEVLGRAYASLSMEEKARRVFRASVTGASVTENARAIQLQTKLHWDGGDEDDYHAAMEHTRDRMADQLIEQHFGIPLKPADEVLLVGLYRLLVHYKV